MCWTYVLIYVVERAAYYQFFLCDSFAFEVAYKLPLSSISRLTKRKKGHIFIFYWIYSFDFIPNLMYLIGEFRHVLRQYCDSTCGTKKLNLAKNLNHIARCSGLALCFGILYFVLNLIRKKEKVCHVTCCAIIQLLWLPFISYILVKLDGIRK